MSHSKRSLLGVALLTVGAIAFWVNHQHQQSVTLTTHEIQDGRQLFDNLCESCHGPDGDGQGGAPALDNGQVLEQYRSLDQLAEFLQQRMPASYPGILTHQQAVDLSLWIRAINNPTRPIWRQS